jgi:hypothetical protein
MKKMFFGGIVVLTIVAAVALNVNKATQNEVLSELALANIEALGQSEIVNKYAVVEYAQGTYICPITGREYLMNVRHCEGNGDKNCG